MCNFESYRVVDISLFGALIRHHASGDELRSSLPSRLKGVGPSNVPGFSRPHSSKSASLDAQGTAQPPAPCASCDGVVLLGRPSRGEEMRFHPTRLPLSLGPRQKGQDDTIEGAPGRGSLGVRRVSGAHQSNVRRLFHCLSPSEHELGEGPVNRPVPRISRCGSDQPGGPAP